MTPLWPGRRSSESLPAWSRVRRHPRFSSTTSGAFSNQAASGQSSCSVERPAASHGELYRFAPLGESLKNRESSSRIPVDEEWSERTAIVTGAASGVGLALSARLAALGAKVVMVDLPGPVLERATV